jgi:hypothetical protein
MAETPEENARTAGTPRWVKVFAIVAVLAVVLVVVLVLTGRGGEHSPRRHIAPAETTPADGGGGHTGPPAGVTHTQP